MREIKFRIYDPLYKEMIEPRTVTDLMEGCYPMGLYVMEGVVREDLLWLQYTGLKDKNGKEIYEGDILTLTYDLTTLSTLKNNILGPVSYCGSGFYFLNYSLDDFQTEHIEILGNVYENPELLGAK